MLREHEKFWAFIALLVCIAVISLPSLIGEVSDTKLTLADKVIVGLIGVLGTVAGSLFSRSADKLAETVQSMARQNGKPKDVTVVNPPEDPVITKLSAPDQEIPDYAK